MASANRSAFTSGHHATRLEAYTLPAARRYRGIVRDENQRRARRLIEFEQQVHDPRTRRSIEVAGRFVRKQHGGPRDERACNRYSLLFSARQLSRIVAFTIAEADRRQRLMRRVASVAAARELEGQHHVFDGGE